MRILLRGALILLAAVSLPAQSLEFGLTGAGSGQAGWAGCFSVSGLGGTGGWVVGGFGEGWFSERFQAGTGGILFRIGADRPVTVTAKAGLGGVKAADRGGALAVWGLGVSWAPGPVVALVLSWDRFEPLAGEGLSRGLGLWGAGLRFRIP